MTRDELIELLPPRVPMRHLFQEAWCLLETMRPFWIVPRPHDGPLTETPTCAGRKQFAALDERVDNLGVPDSLGIISANAVLNFEVRALGIHMPRRRSQVGWVKRDGKSWIGYAYRYELLEDGQEKRRVKQHTVAKCADMTKAEALNEHLKWVAGLDHVQQHSAPSAPRTFQEVWERYKKLKEESGAWGKHHASTLRAVMKHWVLCTIGDADVAALQVDDLMRPLLNMSAAGKNKNYLHHAIQTIRNVMDYAEENVWITHNPARSRFFQKPKSPTPEVHAIEQSQLGSKVIDELQKEENLKLLVAVAVAGIAGARRQELWVLRWDDIVETQIRIDEAWKRYEPAEKRIGKPKTGRTRYVPIGPGVFGVLMKWKAKIKPVDEMAFVFPSDSKHGWPENLDNVLRREMQPFGKRVGIGGLSFRLLRKTAASLFGNDVLSAQAHLGHARPDTTALNYMATPAVEHRNRVTEIDEALLGVPKKSTSKKKSPSKSRPRTSS
jgi:integrase